MFRFLKNLDGAGAPTVSATAIILIRSTNDDYSSLAACVPLCLADSPSLSCTQSANTSSPLLVSNVEQSLSLTVSLVLIAPCDFNESELIVNGDE